MPHAGYHREQAQRCREIAAACDHEATREALEQLAEQYDARADWIEAGMPRNEIQASAPPPAN
jgi:hypothetical protein